MVVSEKHSMRCWMPGQGFVGGMTNRKYASLTKTSPATAQRDLAELVTLNCLVLMGAGRSARYELPDQRRERRNEKKLVAEHRPEVTPLHRRVSFRT